jgi:hypothetical protein
MLAYYNSTVIYPEAERVIWKRSWNVVWIGLNFIPSQLRLYELAYRNRLILSRKILAMFWLYLISFIFIDFLWRNPTVAQYVTNLRKKEISAGFQTKNQQMF